jgi:hypothetical protein
LRPQHDEGKNLSAVGPPASSETPTHCLSKRRTTSFLTSTISCFQRSILSINLLGLVAGIAFVLQGNEHLLKYEIDLQAN